MDGSHLSRLGLTVGVITSGQPQAEKRAAYACDVTYGTNNEFGFDYLRDNLAARLEDRVQRGQSFAIVDEVDSILIDEARTPLIISGPAEESTELYAKIDELVPRFMRQATEEGEGDYYADEKTRQVHLSEAGFEKAEELMQQSGLLREGDSLYDPASIRLMHHLNAALRAHTLYQRDVEYIVRGAEVIIVDEFTGRTMPGRRWSDGLHQAVEAKEGVRIREENQTIASITFQNYFRLYGKLAGMTGTADTEAFEFQQIYGLEVVVVPTHKPMIRKDMSDLVYLNQKDKFDAIIEDIRDCVKRGQPVLVGTTSIETSENLSGHLKQSGIAHAVLNAKQHEREAMIIAQAGRPGTVTIATNMAGRGTDIVLGGNVARQVDQLRKDGAMTEEQLAGRARELENEWQQLHEKVIAAGGLHIVGTERHESRRIDNQLRGRSGRQGDPGSSRFYLSLEDNLMRIFGDPERTKSLLQDCRHEGGRGDRERHADAPDRARAAQGRVAQLRRAQEPARIRRRRERSAQGDLSPAHRDHVRPTISRASIRDVRAEVVGSIVAQYIPPDSVEEQWDVAGLEQAFERDFGVQTGLAAWLAEDPSRHGADGGGAAARRDRRRLRREGEAGRRAGHAPSRARRDAPAARHALARAPGRHGLPAAGDLPARLRAEESRSRSTSGRPLRCSRRCSIASAAIRSRCCSACRSARKRRSSARKNERQRRLQSRMQLQHAPPPELVARVPPAVATAARERSPRRGTRRGAIRSWRAESRPQ